GPVRLVLSHEDGGVQGSGPGGDVGEVTGVLVADPGVEGPVGVHREPGDLVEVLARCLPDPHGYGKIPACSPVRSRPAATRPTGRSSGWPSRRSGRWPPSRSTSSPTRRWSATSARPSSAGWRWRARSSPPP